jgi:hypothetical protein
MDPVSVDDDGEVMTRALLRTIRSLCIALLIVMCVIGVVFGTAALVLVGTINDVKENAATLRAACERENASNKRQILLWEGIVVLSAEEPGAEPENPERLAKFRALLATAYPQTRCPDG